MKVSIVTAYYNRRSLFYQTLKSIAKTAYADFEVIAVDDASNEEERLEGLIDRFPFLRIIRVEPEDKWYYNSCIPFNVGIGQATGDIIVIQNPECLHVHDVITYVVQHVNDANYITISTYSLDKQLTEELPLQVDEGDFIDYFNQLPQRMVEDYVGWYNHPKYHATYFHFCAAITRKNMERLGGFDERFAYGIAYEDNEFADRVSRLGLNRIVTDEVSVIHQWHPRVFDLSNTRLSSLYCMNAALHSKTKKEKSYKVHNSYV